MITALYMDDWSGKLYGGAAVANLTAAAAVVAVSGFVAVYAAVAVLV